MPIPTYWSVSSGESPRSTIGIAEVRTAIEYEYRCTEYRFAEYEYDEIRCEARNDGRNRARASSFSFSKTPDRELRFTALLLAIKASRTLLGIGLPVPGASLQVVGALYSCHTFCRLACTSNLRFPSCQASTFVPF